MRTPLRGPRHHTPASSPITPPPQLLHGTLSNLTHAVCYQGMGHGRMLFACSLPRTRPPRPLAGPVASMPQLTPLAAPHALRSFCTVRCWPACTRRGQHTLPWCGSTAPTAPCRALCRHCRPAQRGRWARHTGGRLATRPALGKAAGGWVRTPVLPCTPLLQGGCMRGCRALDGADPAAGRLPSNHPRCPHGPMR